MTEKQYETLMFTMSMILAAFVDAKPSLPSGRTVGEMEFLTNLCTGETKKIYDFLTANSFEGDYETLIKKMQKAKKEIRRKRMEEERNAKSGGGI